jgi:hypothetical protein
MTGISSPCTAERFPEYHTYDILQLRSTLFSQAEKSCAEKNSFRYSGYS